MFTKKIWLLAVPVAVIAIQGCGGGNGLLSPNRTPQPANTPVPNATATPNVTPVPGTTPIPGTTPAPTNTPVPGTTPAPNPTTAPTPRPTTAPNPTAGNGTGTFSNLTPTNGQNNAESSAFTPQLSAATVSSATINLGQFDNLSQNDPTNNQRTFIIAASNQMTQVFAAGRSYNIVPNNAGNGLTMIFLQRTKTPGAPNGRIDRSWVATSGTITIDSITPRPNNQRAVAFRVVNARFEPSSDRDTRASEPQGNFTFNFSGTAVDSDGR